MTLTNSFIVAFILAGGIRLCLAGFSQKGLPLDARRRLTGRPAKIVGIISLILSFVAAGVWIALKSAVG